MKSGLISSLFMGLAFASLGSGAAVAGKWDEILKERNPWHGFDDDNSVLTVTRVFRAEEGSCQPWLQAVSQNLPGTAVGSGEWARAWEVWAPWSKSDLDEVKDCDSFPCGVKFDHAETSAMALIPETGRLAYFESLVATRVHHYQTAGPEPYEFPGTPVDPWAYLEKIGDTGDLPRPATPSLRARQFNMDPDRMKTLHQILDVRAAASATEATLWTRAGYSDHYFDAWGEWRDIKCREGENHGYTVALVLIVDFDLLKKTDLISRIARGRMRSAIRENGSNYLDRVFEDLKATAAPLLKGKPSG